LATLIVVAPFKASAVTLCTRKSASEAAGPVSNQENRAVTIDGAVGDDAGRIRTFAADCADEVAEQFRAFGEIGYTDILVRHLTNDQPKVLGSLARLAAVRAAVA
jgi:hypothetical protein